MALYISIISIHLLVLFKSCSNTIAIWKKRQEWYAGVKRMNTKHFISTIHTSWQVMTTIYPSTLSCTVSWGRRIHRLHLCRGVKPPSIQWVSWYDTKQSDGEVPVMMELWRRWSTPLFPSFPGSLWPTVVAPDRVLSMGWIDLNCVLMLDWIAWNRTVLTLKLYTYARLNCLKWSCFCMINWIAWNRTVLKFNCV